MELPPPLREAVDRELHGVPTADLARAAGALSQRYRAETRDGRLHVSDDLSARAYLATRLPATFAAVRAAMSAAAELRPDFTPVSSLDVGAGPGTATWAAVQCWGSLADAELVEASRAMRACGERLAGALPIAQVTWHAADAAARRPEAAPRDLVTLAYVLGEVDPAARGPLIERLWTATADMLLIVEPGTPGGWERIIAARALLLRTGAHMVAPCPHALDCPLAAPDWCHFVRRVARSRVHRLAKGGDVPWEDEKFIYLAVARQPAVQAAARVIAPPRAASGRVSLKLCRGDGTAAEQLVTRREAALYKTARRLAWGDVLRDGLDGS